MCKHTASHHCFGVGFRLAGPNPEVRASQRAVGRQMTAPASLWRAWAPSRCSGCHSTLSPAIAQLAEHLTVDQCSNQMVPGSIPGDRNFTERMRVSPHFQRPPTHTSTQSGLCLHRGIAPQLSGRISATQLRLQASSVQQQYIAVLQSRFVRRHLHRWSP